MKRIFALLLCAAMLLSFAACQSTAAEGEQQQEEEEQTVQATLYLPNENADGFDTERVELAEDSPQALVDALIERGALPEGTEVLGEFDRSAQTPTVDLSQEFADAMASTGTTGESMLMGSLVNTFLYYYGIDSISVTAQGQVIETGHTEYSQPMGVFEMEDAA